MNIFELKEAIKGVFYSMREADKYDDIIIHGCKEIREILGYEKTADSYVRVGLNLLVNDGFLIKVELKRKCFYKINDKLVYVQKKCTCPAYAKGFKGYICGRCGGVL